MRQRKLGSHTPLCHRRMVITTLFNVMLAAGGGGGVGVQMGVQKVDAPHPIGPDRSP